MKKNFYVISNEKDIKKKEDAMKALPNYEWLNKPCSDYFKNGDIVIVSMTGIEEPDIKHSFQRNHGRVGEVIYSGDKSITVKYAPNPRPESGGFGVSGSWTESFGTFDLAQGRIRLYKD